MEAYIAAIQGTKWPLKLAIELGRAIHMISFAVYERCMVRRSWSSAPTVSESSLGQIMYNKVGVPKRKAQKGRV